MQLLEKFLFIFTSSLLIVIAAFNPAFSDVAVTAENFPDDNFRDYIINELGADTDNDGYLSDNEIAAVRLIQVYEKDIADLSGIEYFSALEELYCYTNNIEALDVSRNGELLLLECDNNRLTKLNINNNTKLMNLECEANNLAELNLSSNVNLVYVKCYGQTLNSLTVSGDSGQYKVNLSSYVSDLNKISGVTAYDDDGNIIDGMTFDITSGIVSSDSFPARIIYGYLVDYVNDSALSMDVTITAAAYDGTGPGDPNNDCGNGCNAGWNIFAFVVLLVLMLGRSMAHKI